MTEEKKNYLREWIKKAENDLKNARIILDSFEEDKPFDTVCFHCQQSVEKLLKAYLVYHGISFSRTHSIAQLIGQGSDVDPELEQIIDAEILSPYGVEVRYPGYFHYPSEEEAEQSYALAQKARCFLLERMKL